MFEGVGHNFMELVKHTILLVHFLLNKYKQDTYSRKFLENVDSGRSFVIDVYFVLPEINTLFNKKFVYLIYLLHKSVNSSEGSGGGNSEISSLHLDSSLAGKLSNFSNFVS